jgi:hypothetical protein
MDSISKKRNIIRNTQNRNIVSNNEYSGSGMNNIILNAQSEQDSDTNLNNIQKEVYYLSKKLVPYFDKIGRTISDMGSHLNYNLRNNKLEE